MLQIKESTLKDALGASSWACGCQKLDIAGREAEVYSDALAVGTLDPERSDVLSKIRRDFDAAGVMQSDEQILHVMNELMLEAGSQMPVTRGEAADLVRWRSIAIGL